MSYRIIQGDRHRPAVAMQDSSGAALNMTSGSRSITLRLKHATTSSVTTFSVTWTTQASGLGYFNISTSASAALTVGNHAAEVVYTDSDSADETFTLGTWVVNARATAA